LSRVTPAHAPHLERGSNSRTQTSASSAFDGRLAVAIDRLALEVAHVDRVVVDQHQRADARAGEVLQRRRADPAEADQRDRGPRQRRLPAPPISGSTMWRAKAVEAVGGKAMAALTTSPARPAQAET
jgi:hypothetical protein